MNKLMAGVMLVALLLAGMSVALGVFTYTPEDLRAEADRLDTTKAMLVDAAETIEAQEARIAELEAMTTTTTTEAPTTTTEAPTTTTTTEAPTGIVAPVLSVSEVSATSVTLSWTDSGAEAGYRVRQSTDNDTFVMVGDLGADVLTFTADGLSENTTYFFKVQAHDGQDTEASNVVSAETSGTTSTTEAPTTTTTEPTSTSCEGVHVSAGSNLKNVVEDGTGQTYCLDAGVFQISGASTTVTLEDGDSLVGAGRDQTFIVGVNGAQNLLEGAPQAHWEVRSLDISGAVGNEACAPNCGRAMKGSGDTLIVEDVRCHHNENQCIGTGNADLYFINNECDNNGDEEFVTFKATRSTSCMKRIRGGPGIYTEVRDSFIHDNFWEGVWFDFYEGSAVVENNVIIDNGKAAVGWEVSGGFAGTPTPALVLRGNDLSGNGNAPWANIGAGIVCNTCAHGLIDNNDFGNSGPDDAIAFISSSRAWGSIHNMVVQNNRLHGDELDCSDSGVTCSNNTP